MDFIPPPFTSSPAVEVQNVLDPVRSVKHVNFDNNGKILDEVICHGSSKNSECRVLSAGYCKELIEDFKKHSVTKKKIDECSRVMASYRGIYNKYLDSHRALLEKNVGEGFVSKPGNFKKYKNKKDYKFGLFDLVKDYSSCEKIEKHLSDKREDRTKIKIDENSSNQEI